MDRRNFCPCRSDLICSICSSLNFDASPVARVATPQAVDAGDAGDVSFFSYDAEEEFGDAIATVALAVNGAGCAATATETGALMVAAAFDGLGGSPKVGAGAMRAAAPEELTDWVVPDNKRVSPSEPDKLPATAVLAEEPEIRLPVGLAAEPSPRNSASTSSRGASRFALMSFSKPSSRCRRGSGARRNSASVAIRVLKNRVKSSSVNRAAWPAIRSRSSLGACTRSEVAPQTRATSKLRKCRMASRQKCCKFCPS